MRGIGLVHLAQETERGGWCVERRTIVKADALTKLESVGEAVRADCPGSGETGFRLRGAVSEAHETLADVDEDFDRFAVIHVGGVELLRISPPGEGQGRWFGLVGALTTGEDEDEGEKGEPFHCGMVTDRPQDGKQGGLTRMTGGLKLVKFFKGFALNICNE